MLQDQAATQRICAHHSHEHINPCRTERTSRGVPVRYVLVLLLVLALALVLVLALGLSVSF